MVIYQWRMGRYVWGRKSFPHQKNFTMEPLMMLTLAVVVLGILNLRWF